MAKIINSKVKNIPWQDKPANCNDPVWRYTENPIIDRSFVKEANSIFNSAVVPYGNGFAGVFRKKYGNMGFIAGVILCMFLRFFATL